jgi:tetratricopeptide (TPR) repeat protein
MRRLAPVLALLAATAAPAELYTWVDDAGRTHVTDDLAEVPSGVRERVVSEGAGLSQLWDDGLRGPPVRPAPGATSDPSDRVVRLLRGAVDDLRRGETARAITVLENVLELEPARPEAHWYLALLDRQRGRFDSAESHLQAFLASAGEDLAPWRASAERRLAELQDERRLADETRERGPLTMRETRSRHFEVRYDAELDATQPGYLGTVTGYLEEARSQVGDRLGVFPDEPTRVLFYGKASYLRAHAHRFSFRTVGFFDGRIHVVSAAHPGGELRSLLHHEYTHALFRQVVGSDRPMWLNEGLAELSERASRAQPALSRGERFALKERSVTGGWISLARLGPGFGGLEDEDARIAYLEATAAAAWVEAHTDRAGRARLLALLAAGRSADAALAAVTGVDGAGLERGLRRALEAEFPSVAPASAGE